MDFICIMFLLFLIYSVIGYFIEVLAIFLDVKKINLNRGFLIGPYLPIFGFGSLIILYALTKYRNDYFVLFISGFILSGLLEYVTSYVMEKIYGLRWWDYSTKKFNINGRICLENLVYFGLIGIFIVQVINPFIVKYILMLNQTVLYTITILLFIIVLIDFIISVNVAFSVKKVLETNTLKFKDHTKEIKGEFKKMVGNLNILNRRLFYAFPHTKYRIKSISERIKDRIAK